jgi:hypothetical protein
MEYDLVVNPDADAGQIKFEFAGASRISVDDSGDLVLETLAGASRHKRPVIYQEIDGTKRGVDGGYTVSGNRVGFSIGSFDRSKPLVIDPVAAPPPALTYSTFFGSQEQPVALKLDSSSNAYIAGTALDADFPQTSGTNPGSFDAFVAKISSSGSGLIYAVLIGGVNEDRAYSLDIDSSGNAYLAGGTTSTDFPVSWIAYDKSLGGFMDAFVAKIGPNGNNKIYSTYVGGAAGDGAVGIAVDAAGSAYITGTTASQDFPTTAGAFDKTMVDSTDAFVTKLAPGGNALTYSTYLGGNSWAEFANAIAVDAHGQAFVTGNGGGTSFPVTPGTFSTVHNPDTGDCFVAKLAANGGSLIYGVLIGGDDVDKSNAIALDGANNAYITGTTQSANYPLTIGAFDHSVGTGSSAFVTKINPSATALSYSTYLGGNDGVTEATSIAVNPAGAIYVTGFTSSDTFPLVLPSDQVFEGGGEVFLTKFPGTQFSPLAASTFIGGSGYETGWAIGVNSAGDAFVTGVTGSPNFPITANALDGTMSSYGSDMFVLRYHHSWLP